MECLSRKGRVVWSNGGDYLTMLQGKNIPNIGGYDDNAFKDHEAVHIVSTKLLESHCIMPHIDSSNTIPNTDGSIEICEKRGNRKIPVATFVVQIKSLPEDYINHNKRLHKDDHYKYCCDTKAFNVALFQPTLNPVLLMMVDIQTRTIFWKYLSNKYCRELESFKVNDITIYFNDEDKISDIKEWSLKLKKIFEEKRSKIRPMDEPIPEEFQVAFERLNSVLDNELLFIKQIFFPDIWKLGISYFIDSESQFKSLGIYKVPNGQNDLFIKNFNDAREINFMEMQYYGHSASEVVNLMLMERIDLLFKEKNYFLCIMPDMVIEDIIFDILDSHFAKKIRDDIPNGQEVILGYPNDEISLDELQQILTDEQWDYQDVNLLKSCMKELTIRNDFNHFHRFWRKYLKRTVVHLNNGVRYQFGGDVISIAKDNIERFLKNFSNFYNKTIHILGNKTKNLFDTGDYTVYISKDLKGFSYIKQTCEILKLSWSFESKSSRELYDEYRQRLSESFTYGECAMHPQAYLTYSWYDIWQIWCYFTFSKFIAPSDNKSNPFIETLHYFRNYYGDSHHYVVTSDIKIET